MSKMKTKRVLAGVMAALLALGSVPAMASSVEEAGETDMEEMSGYTATLAQSEGGSLAFHDVEGDSAVFAEGDTVTVDILPDDGYEVFMISVTDSEDGRTGLYEECVADQYSFTMPAADILVRGEFTASAIPEEEMTVEAESEEEPEYEEETGSEDEPESEEEMAVKVLSLSVSDIAPYSVSVGDSIYTQSSRHIDGTTAGMVYQYDDNLADGYSKSWHASYMYVNGEASAVFCIDADTDFEDGYKTVYDASSYFSDSLLSQIAIGQVWIDDYCKENGVANNIKYLLKQCYTWRRISNSQNLDYDQMMIDYNLISKSTQESVYSNALQYAKDNKNRYTYGGYVYIGEGQSLASFWAEPLPDNGYLTLEKSSEITAITDGNSCYSFKGIQYQVYADSSCSEKAVDADGANALLEVEDDGTANTLEMEAGDYWVKEIESSVTGTGYAADSSVYMVSVSEENTEDVPAVINVSDIPQSNTVSVLLRKIDKDSGKTAPSGNASLAGAEFEISYYDGYYASASEVSGKSAVRTWVIKTDEDGVAKLSSKYLVSGELYHNSAGDPTIPLGTVTVKETAAPEGYAMDETVHVITIKASGTAENVDAYNEPTFSEPVIRGGVMINKVDQDLWKNLGFTTPQGDATLTGATFEIVNNSANSVRVNGKDYASGEVVMTVKTEWDADRGEAVAKTAADALPYGSYTIRETGLPNGYKWGGTVSRDFNIEKNGVVVDLCSTPIINSVISGGVMINKVDQELWEAFGLTMPQGDATLSGAEFEIVNNSANSVWVDGKNYANGEVVMTIQTEWDAASGKAVAKTSADALPYGSYTIRETGLPTGYKWGGTITRDFTIEEEGVIVDLCSTPIINPVIRGGVAVQKRDVQSLRDEPQGNASFEGITLEITNDSENAVLVDGVLYDPGEVILTLITDETGYAETASDALPYGTYTIAETEVPGSESRVEGDGYLLGNGSHDTAAAQANTSIRFNIEEDGVIVDLTGDEGSAIDPEDGFTDQVKRGDIALVKHRADTQSAMGSVEFEITSLTTGENHIFWTDENGNYSSDSTWNKHSYNTNAGEDWTDGLWFYGYADGEESGEEVDDSLGALPVDDYRLDELPCEANEGMELYHGTFSVYEDIRVIDLNTIYNEPEEVYSVAWLRSQAWAGDTGTQISYADGYVTLYDDIFYYGLEPGVEYHIYGVALDAETREPEYDHYGEKICALTTFTPTEPDGMEVQEFYFDVEDLSGRRVVFYETIYMIDEDGNTVLVAAEDVADAPNETIYFPDVGTTLVDAESGEHATRAGDTVTLVDTVTVTEVPEGENLIVYGTLMNKSTGEALLDADGNPVTAYVEFVSAGLDPQTVELGFVFDASALAGDAVVAFEDLYLVIDEETLALVGRHADLEDEGQTVTFAPEIHTTLTDAETGTHEAVADGTIVLNDVVRYEGLTPGKEYMVSGILMDKETGEELLDADGREITAESDPFIPEEADGEVTVTFTFDSEDLAGISAVAFEYLYDVNGELVASHEDLTDEDQTVDLIEKETPPVEPETPVETPEETPTETPEGTITNVPTTVSTGTPAETTETTTTTRPKTGDTRTVWPLICVIGAAGVGIAVLIRRRFGVKA